MYRMFPTEVAKIIVGYLIVPNKCCFGSTTCEMYGVSVEHLGSKNGVCYGDLMKILTIPRLFFRLSLLQEAIVCSITDTILQYVYSDWSPPVVLGESRLEVWERFLDEFDTIGNEIAAILCHLTHH